MADLYSYKMKLFAAGCVFLAYFVHALVARQKECSISVHGQSEKNSPILLLNETTLIVPRNGKINLKPSESIIAACPDPKNYLIGTQLNITQATCVQGSILRVANRDRNFEELQCQKVIRGSVAEGGRKCGNNKGRIYKIGYPVSAKSFLTLIEACYDDETAEVFYTEHLLRGEDIKYASKSNYRPSFSPQGTSTAVSVAYKQSFQKATFNKLLKSASLSNMYVNRTSYLARGHLSPDTDFLFAATQYTTYYYINVVPQWQAINGANWKKVESLVRKFASALQETLTVSTGTHGVLTLPDVNGNEEKIFLVSGSKLPVPKFIWKIVYSKQSRKAIVFVSLNNPYIREVAKGDLLCQDVCNKFGWGSSSWKDFKKGFIICCDYADFSKHVPTAPKLQVVGVFEASK